MIQKVTFSPPTLEGQRSTQRERLFFIEFTLVFLGRLGRKDLVRRFEISEPAATKDLSLYAELAPDVLQYDLRQKCYLYIGGRLQFTHEVDRSLLALAGDRAITQASAHAVHLVSSVGISIKRRVSVELVSAITRSMHQRESIFAVYRSLSSGERERELSPLALIHDGLRWHIRCFDHESALYKDYNLARFLSVRAGGESHADLENDEDWNLSVDLSLVAHPKSAHPETTHLDYDFDGVVRTVKLRSCLVGYFLRHWPIDYTDEASDNPRHHQLYLANKNELIAQGVSRWAFEH